MRTSGSKSYLNTVIDRKPLSDCVGQRPAAMKRTLASSGLGGSP